MAESGGLNTVNNDDRVLQCCLQYRAMYPEGAVILCTNDKNLCSKALLSGVQALSKADLQEQAEVNPDFHHRYAQTSAYLHTTPVTQQHQEKPLRSCEEVKTSRRKETEREVSECVSAMESSLQSALSAILEEEMKAAFGELWLELSCVLRTALLSRLGRLHRLSAALEQLLEAFQRLLSVGSTVEDAQALLTFTHTSEMAAMEPGFTAKDLSHQEYREKLCIGGVQLMDMREKLYRRVRDERARKHFNISKAASLFFSTTYKVYCTDNHVITS